MHRSLGLAKLVNCNQILGHVTDQDYIEFIRGFPKVDHSGIDARIVLEQNKFTKKATSNRT